jgi:hypothetical protein
LAAEHACPTRSGAAPGVVAGVLVVVAVVAGVAVLVDFDGDEELPPQPMAKATSASESVSAELTGGGSTVEIVPSAYLDRVSAPLIRFVDRFRSAQAVH